MTSRQLPSIFATDLPSILISPDLRLMVSYILLCYTIKLKHSQRNCYKSTKIWISTSSQLSGSKKFMKVQMNTTSRICNHNFKQKMQTFTGSNFSQLWVVVITIKCNPTSGFLQWQVMELEWSRPQEIITEIVIVLIKLFKTFLSVISITTTTKFALTGPGSGVLKNFP